MSTIVTLNSEGPGNNLFAIDTKTVLVIDDQKSARMILEGVVRCIDPYIKVKAFASPLEAIECARGETPDLVLTDYKMREIDGIETIKRLRQLPTCTDMPIVMLTVSVDTKVRHAAFDAGVTDFLIKPYDHYECRARCRNLLAMREQHLLLRDRAKLLEYEVRAAVRQMRARERETILVAASLGEYHAHQDGLRVLRIARYARLIAEGMGVQPDIAERIELASTLHDVGKIGIADDILISQTSLTEAQEQTLQEHTEIGHKLLEQSTSEYLKMAADIALHHHERYDGLGYPRGLKGHEIPLPARIVTVAEAFDMLTTDPDRDRSDQMAAAKHAIVSGKGTAFDPVCVEALCSQLENAGEVMATFSDPA